MSWALCLQIVFQAPQHFRSSETQAGLPVMIFLCPPVYLLGHLFPLTPALNVALMATPRSLLKLVSSVVTCQSFIFSLSFDFRPNVCTYQDMELVVVRQPCVQAFTRLVKVWKPHCGYTRNWCVGYERRSVLNQP